MKYAVKVDGMYQELAFDPQLARLGINGSKTTTYNHAIAEGVAKARGGKVVRVLSHEEAKRKAAALALLAHVRWCRDNMQGTWCSVAQAELEAERLWPALFHGGDGKTPRGK